MLPLRMARCTRAYLPIQVTQCIRIVLIIVLSCQCSRFRHVVIRISLCTLYHQHCLLKLERHAHYNLLLPAVSLFIRRVIVVRALLMQERWREEDRLGVESSHLGAVSTIFSSHHPPHCCKYPTPILLYPAQSDTIPLYSQIHPRSKVVPGTWYLPDIPYSLSEMNEMDFDKCFPFHRT